MFRSTSSLEGPPGPRRELVLFRRGVQAALLGIVLLLSMVLGAAPASGYWSALGTGVTTATVGTLTPPTNVTARWAVLAGKVAVSWTSSAGPLAPAGYYVTRITPNTTPMPACGSGPGALIMATSCMDTAPAGSHSYQVTAVYHSWTAVSDASLSVTVIVSLNDRLAFASQPSNVTAGTLPAVSVQLLTPGLEIIPVPKRTANVAVTLSLGTNPAGGILNGDLTAHTNADGLATFRNLSLTKAGAGYHLVASAEGYVGVSSNPFAVTAAAAAQVVVTSPATVAGVASATANIGPIMVERRDEFGNPATVGPSTVTLTSDAPNTGLFATSTGGPGVTLVSFPAESASTSFHYGDTKAGSKTITAKGIGADLIMPVDITPAQPSRLVFDLIQDQVSKVKLFSATVRIVDAFGNRTDSTAPVTIKSTGVILRPSGDPECIVKDTAITTVAPGAASFPGLHVSGMAAGCRLTASSPGLADEHSNVFGAV